MQIRTILYQYIKTLIEHVFLLNFTHELLMSFRKGFRTLIKLIISHVRIFMIISHVKNIAFQTIIIHCLWIFYTARKDCNLYNKQNVLKLLSTFAFFTCTCTHVKL